MSTLEQSLRPIEDAGFNWYIARGRQSPGEPLFALQIIAADDQCVSRESDHQDPYIIEGDDLHALIIRAQAFVEQQER